MGREFLFILRETGRVQSGTDSKNSQLNTTPNADRRTLGTTKQRDIRGGKSYQKEHAYILL
jgi:hypothetical protein